MGVYRGENLVKPTQQGSQRNAAQSGRSSFDCAPVEWRIQRLFEGVERTLLCIDVCDAKI